ncbi:MAG TPA: condensation domain-containing protein [Pseudonocardiaceae bacterium]|nr:condensation domain-containing protein [Pseudonocardiaceae bacterium]
MPDDVLLPVSFAQQRLWFLDQMSPGSSEYLIPVVLRLTGDLDVAALSAAVADLFARHESLRTVIAEQDGRPVQIVRDSASRGLRVIDEPVGPEDVAATALAPMNLGRGPLFRAVLFCQEAQEHILVLTVHHIVADGWSIGIISAELEQLYAAHQAGVEPGLPELPIQYADFAIWQRDVLDGPVLDEQLAYWSTQLAGLTPLELPTDRPRPATRSSKGAEVSFEIPAELSRRLTDVFNANRVTPFMGLLAAFQVLLARCGGQQDIAVGIPVAGRDRLELEGLIGLFLNTVIMRADLSGDPTFAQLLAQVRETTLAAYDHQDLPFERLVEHLAPERDLSRIPLLQTMFTMQDSWGGRHGWQLPGLRVGVESQESVAAKFDLSIEVSRTEVGFTANLEYSTVLFDRTTIERMASQFLALLDGAAADPETAVSRLPMPTTDLKIGSTPR